MISTPKFASAITWSQTEIANGGARSRTLRKLFRVPLSRRTTSIVPASRLPMRATSHVQPVFSSRLCRSVAPSGRAEIVKGRSNETEGGGPRLSTREIAVLTAMADGRSNKEIARRLGISFHTVKFHVASILEKLEVDTRTEAVIKAAQLGLVML